MAHARLITFAFLLVACGTNAPAVRSTAPPRPARVEPAPPSLEARAFRTLRSKNMSLAVTLPDGDGWAIDDGPQWFRLRHAATDSELSLRVWRASRRVKVAECERELRLVRGDLPDATVEPESIVEQRRLGAPAGYTVELTVAVRRAEGERIAGYAVALGAGVGRCYAAVFATHAGGTGAESAVAERLALAADQMLESVTPGQIDDRVP